MHIGIVENDSEFRDNLLFTLKKLLPAAKIDWWQSAEGLLKEDSDKLPEILLLDVMLPGMTGIDLTRELTRGGYAGKIVILTNMNSDSLILEAIENGAVGYVLKSDRRELKSIIETVLAGGAILTPTIALRVMTALKSQRHESPDFGLSERLQQVLDLMVAGKTIPQVAKALRLSATTVHGYVKDIYKKLNVHNRAELVGRVHNRG
ncbi:response regulator transcription factor [Turneriella parva]|uniref:Two component transcriptional regulator, LuxR family n=1 Tax=Turneriella parva (strain ATCC BAA-1111 / DSM 21527 / NCTC 11395 / H) TaxID=869212 RepID=I4B4K8_TURPD|nr:response regulator transcription factor [Turneriella parva]AFM12215.1 two component transcriptional regulator, LuxR family [Turneriella parva DSM 21527]